MDTRALAEKWAAAYQRAWQAGDADAMADLYAEDVVHYVPFQGGHHGRAAIRAMLTEVMDGVTYDTVRLTVKLVDGDRAYGEYWVTGTHPQHGPFTMAGNNLLRFNSDGHTSEVHDLIALHPGQQQPDGPWAA